MKLTTLSLLIFFTIVFICCESTTNKDSSTSVSTKSTDKIVSRAQEAYAKGKEHYKKTNYTEAFKAFSASAELYLSIEDSTESASSYLAVAAMQKELGDLKGSEATSTKALKLGGDNLDQITKVGLYNNLASTTKELGDFEDALYWNSQAQKASTNPKLNLILKSNRYNIYLTKGDYNIAKDSIKILLKDSLMTITANRKDFLRSLGYYGEALSNLKDSSAEAKLKQALEGWKKYGDKNGELYANLHLAEHYLSISDPEKTIQYSQQALKLSNQTNDVAGKLKALSYLISAMPNPKQEAVVFNRLSDSLQLEERLAKEQFAKIQFDTEANRKAVLQLRVENAERDLALSEAHNRTLWLGGISLLLVGFGFLYYRYSTERQKKERLQVSYNTEKKISKRVHDELANDVYQLMTKIQTNESIDVKQKTNYLDDLESVYHRSRDISRETAEIDTLNFEIELRDLVQAFNSNHQRVIVKSLKNVPWKNINDYKKVTLYRVLQELLTNFRKHSEATICTIEFRPQKKTLEIIYADNGVGMPKNNRISKNGLQNAENRMDAISGSLIFEDESVRGAKAMLNVPL